nr:MAG TPA: hypothetical protein [Caudoviricetes sp.]
MNRKLFCIKKRLRTERAVPKGRGPLREVAFNPHSKCTNYLRIANYLNKKRIYFAES